MIEGSCKKSLLLADELCNNFGILQNVRSRTVAIVTVKVSTDDCICCSASQGEIFVVYL